MNEKKLIVVAGPTAVGKTSLAINLALELKTIIFSADSRQLYKELNIGVARPTKLELETVEHLFIASNSIESHIDVAQYENEVLNLLEEKFNHFDNILLVGGSGLYIDAICHGIDEMPNIPENIRASINSSLASHGIEYLVNYLEKNDPEILKTIDKANPRRLSRAAEVFMSTGQSISNFKTKTKKHRPFSIHKYLLSSDKEDLHKKIDHRVDLMFQNGLVEEVKSLAKHRHLKALDTVGYKEVFEYLDNNISLEECIALIKTHTHQYAKRQLTWFKKDKEYIPVGINNNPLQIILERLNYAV